MSKTIATLSSGIGIFIFSVFLINFFLSSDVLARSKRLPSLLGSPLSSFLSGFVCSVITQSSSAINSVAVQLADKDLLKKNNKYFIVIGTNIGTTITAYFAVIGNLSFSKLILAIMPVLAIALMASKNQLKTKYIAIICAFCMIFAGINIISLSVPNILSAIDLTFLQRSNYFVLLAIAALITAVCQSSSLITLIVVMLGQSGMVSAEGAIFLIMGANLGTCSSALLSSIGKNGNGKSVAIFNLVFNLCGVLINVFAFYTGLLNWFIGLSVAIDTKIALYHTFFNLVGAIFFIPLLSEKSLLKNYKNGDGFN